MGFGPEIHMYIIAGLLLTKFGMFKSMVSIKMRANPTSDINRFLGHLAF